MLGTLQGNEEEGLMMGECIGLMNDRGYDTLANCCDSLLIGGSGRTCNKDKEAEGDTLG